MRHISAYWVHQCQAMSKIADDNKFIILELHRQYVKYRRDYLKLVQLANDLIEDVPRILRNAVAEANVLSPPNEISDFIKLCKGMANEFRARMNELR